MTVCCFILDGVRGLRIGGPLTGKDVGQVGSLNHDLSGHSQSQMARRETIDLSADDGVARKKKAGRGPPPGFMDVDGAEETKEEVRGPSRNRRSRRNSLKLDGRVAANLVERAKDGLDLRQRVHDAANE
jgi:hypothetical protein